MNKEVDHEKVFGDSFANYQKDELKPLIYNLEKRFFENKIDCLKTFQNKVCLDAGCGGGPASLFMAKNHAKKIHAVDISKQNVKTTKNNAKKFMFDKTINCSQSSIEQLPFDDQTFDVVWSYGVLHHTQHPDKCLTELTRVLKVGGQLIIFMYGDGGILWYTVFQSRKFVENISIDYCRKVLNFTNTEINMLISIMDNWKVPYLRTYSSAEIVSRLENLSYRKSNPWKFGMHWDTNHRLNTFKSDKEWMGQGDIRISAKKLKSNNKISSNKLHDYNVRPNINFDKKIIDTYSEVFKKINLISNKNKFVGLIAHKKIFIKLADLLKENNSFKYEEYLNFLESIYAELKVLIDD